MMAATAFSRRPLVVQARSPVLLMAVTAVRPDVVCCRWGIHVRHYGKC